MIEATKSQAEYEHPTREQLAAMWMAVGNLALAGRLRLAEVRFLCETIALYGVWCESERNRTRTAEKLETHRRRVRVAIADWNKPDGVSRMLTLVCGAMTTPPGAPNVAPGEER